MDKYYFLSNSSKSHKNDPLYPKHVDIFNSSSLYEYIKNGIVTSCLSESHEKLEEFLHGVFYLVDENRGRSSFNFVRFYNEFYLTLTSIDYHLKDLGLNEESVKFINDHDFTAVYYNYAYIHYMSGDVLNFLHYLSLADSEYASKRNDVEGALISSLIKSNSFALWNLVPNIISDYHNFKNYKSHYNVYEEALKTYQIELSKEMINGLLSDFKYDLFLQLVYTFRTLSSLSTSYNFREHNNNNGKYKAPRRIRLLGELTWNFEVYLKDKLQEKYPEETFSEPLDKTIQSFLGKVSTENRTKYSQLSQSLFDEFGTKDRVNSEGIKYLLSEIENSEMKTDEHYLHCLLLIRTFRNYYSHYMNRMNNWGNGYFDTLALKLAILNSFFITKSLFDTM